MASEELQSRYPDGKGRRIAEFELFQTQLVTLRQCGEAGILPNKDYGQFASQKADTLIIKRDPMPTAIVVSDDKLPKGLTPKNWEKLADDLLKTKCHPTGALIGYLTDGITTKWINGRASTVVEITREDGKPMPQVIDFANKTFIAELSYIINYFDPAVSSVRLKSRTNPALLAKEVWQTIWRLKADRPEDCLATFVELFLFKFLDDLALLKANDDGVKISVEAVMALNRDVSYKYYEKHIRPHIKKMFPDGLDGYSIINGIVLQSSNRDHNLIFYEIMKKFIKFGSLKNTDPEFKTRLYESFLQESKTTTTFGQFFTPRKVVASIHDMASIDKMPAGREICDPAAGVGGFILEQMARDLDAQWKLSGNKMTPVHKWHAMEIVPKTAILAKANALVHCGELLADHPARIKSFAKWLNNVFVCKDKTSLGSLEDMLKEKYDLIITNPPFVVSGSADVGKIIKSDNKRAIYFGRKYSGIEGLFIQFIVQSLKRNGDAWVLLPETFFLRTTDQTIRKWMFQTCVIDLLAILPERTFFNTTKRVVIVHMRRRQKNLSEAVVATQLESEKVLLFAVSEIGETRDAKRLPCESDLPQLVKCYRQHAAGSAPDNSIQNATTAKSIDIANRPSVNLRHFWDKQTARDLGLVGADEDPLKAKVDLDEKMRGLADAAQEWLSVGAKKPPPHSPIAWREVKLGNAEFFRLSIGQRVLKREVHTIRKGVPLFSANIRKPFGFVHAANAGNLEFGGCLWSIDSDFDCRSVSPGEVYSITDHCGQIELLCNSIDPSFLAGQVRQAGLDQGFNRDYRPSLGLMATLEVELPVKENGDFDLAIMEEWAAFQNELEKTSEDLSRLLKVTND